MSNPTPLTYEPPIVEGMTLRQYAAIKLKVPDSGTDWLDEMIAKSLLNDFAVKAMQGELAPQNAETGEFNNPWQERAKATQGETK